jgi:hypothetical protein
LEHPKDECVKVMVRARPMNESEIIKKSLVCVKVEKDERRIVVSE